MLIKNILLRILIKKNIMLINYNFNKACSDDVKFLYEGLVENMKKYDAFFKVEFCLSKNVGVEIIERNGDMGEARLRLFRMKANRELKKYSKKYSSS